MTDTTVEPVVARHARFPLIDGVRAIAALTIFAFHVFFHLGLLNTDLLSRYLGNLNVGVPIFFVVSGFLIYRPFVAKRFAQEPSPETEPYAIRRALRIVPAYWVALVIVTLILGLEASVFTPSGIVTYFGFLQVYDIGTVVGGIFFWG
jgi:peptidoglycan/LPS O-acetylase OafA/YrhL